MTSHTGTEHEDGLEVFLREIDEENEKAAKVKDERLIGFQFINGIDRGKTPLDFRINPDTGKTDSGSTPFSISKLDLRQGIQGVNIPCLFLWKKGRWLTEFEDKDAPIKDVDPERVGNISLKKHNDTLWEWQVWIVHGEGMPGAFSFYAYLLPHHICALKQGEVPKHPMLWGKRYKDGIGKHFMATNHWKWASSNGAYGGSYHSSSVIASQKRYEDSWMLLLDGHLPGYQQPGNGSQWLPKPKEVVVTPAVPVVKADPLPTGIRFRCPGCGHWFDESGLKGHSKVCPGMDSQGISDWAVMCHKDCGCEVLAGRELGDKTLDDVASCKPGFPRSKEEVSDLSTTEAEPDEGTSTPEPEPEEGTASE